MPICSIARRQLVELFGSAEALTVLRRAERQDSLESHWRQLMSAHFHDQIDLVMAYAKKHGKLSFVGVDFEDFLMQHKYSVVQAGIVSTRDPGRVQYSKLSRDPAGMSLAALQRWWDAYRKSGKADPKIQERAKEIKTRLENAMRAAWKIASYEFLEGKDATKDDAIDYIRREAQIPFPRAKSIVETATTDHYNSARRQVYDQSPDVTHYLSMSIRDHRTTEWCKDRHGLVYDKKDPITDEEQPARHPYCRSEYLPLTPQNPRHLALINDLSRARRMNVCKPLLPGWGHRRVGTVKLKKAKPMQPVFLVCGVPGSGKTWVCDQLAGRYVYVPHDKFMRAPKEDFVQALHHAATVSTTPVITDCPFGETKLRELMVEAGLTVKPFFIVETAEVAQDRYMRREGKALGAAAVSRCATIKDRALEWDSPYGTSAEVLVLLMREAESWTPRQ